MLEYNFKVFIYIKQDFLRICVAGIPFFILFNKKYGVLVWKVNLI